MKIKGFTPCFDTIIEKYSEVDGKCVPARGLRFASIYGKVWRYEQMKDKKCRASQSRIARELGLTRQNVNQCLGILADDGYIKALKVSRMVEYITTGKADMVLGVEDELSSQDTPPVTPADDTCHPSGHIPVTPDDTKIQVKDTNKENNKKRGGVNKESIKPPPTPPEPIWNDRNTHNKNLGLPEILVFTEVTGRQSGMNQIESIYGVICDYGFTAEYLKPFWKTWNDRGYNPRNLAWLLEWAVDGTIPEKPPPSKRRGQGMTQEEAVRSVMEYEG